MIKHLLDALGLSPSVAIAAARAPHAPYPTPSTNLVYNLLFCDEPARFAVAPGNAPSPWQRTLFAEPADPTALRALAVDSSQEGRVRYLAFSKLRQLGQQVPPKILLGVIIEVPLERGLDTLAAFSEGGVHYINQADKLLVVEDMNIVKPQVMKLFASVERSLDRIGPWTEQRLAPPKEVVRFTFLVSDGMYFGQGPMEVMQTEAIAGPIIHQGAVLLQAVTEIGLKAEKQAQAGGTATLH